MDFHGESNSCDSVELQNIQLMTTPGASPYFTVADTAAVFNGTLHVDDTYNDTQHPYVDIVEQPQPRGFRFRYECEGPSHGGLQGERTERSHKTYPSIRINNYQGPAQIEVSLVTDENPPRIHAHKLVGKNCKDGVCRMNISSTASVISFPNLCVLHVTRKKAIEVLLHRILEDIKLNKQLSGVNLSSEQLISAEEHVRAKKQAEEQARSMALNVVRLQFRVFLPSAEDQYLTMLSPVVSKPIYDSKDILVRFVEYDKHGNVKWEALGNFSPLDVHRQFAIVFRTPAYVNTDIDKSVIVHIMLQRKSDNEVSEPKTFTYYPQNRDKDFIARKKRKALPLDNTFGNSCSGHGAGTVYSGDGIGEGFRPLGIDFGVVGGGGEQSRSNYSVIMPDGNVVDQLNVLPATVEQAVKEEFAHSPQSVTVEDWSEMPDNFLEAILTDDLEIDAAPSLRHPSQMVSTTGNAAPVLKSKPHRNSSSMVMKLSKDDKLKARNEQNKDSSSDKLRKDSVSNESKKDSQLDKSRKDSDDDKQKRDSKDEKQSNDSDNNKQTDMEHVKERDDSTLTEGEEGKEPNRTGLSLHEGKACTTDTVEKDRPKVCSASKTEIVRAKTELKEPDQQKETLVRKSGATDETADKQNPKTHSISDSGGEKHSGTIPSPTRMGHIASSEGMRTDEGFSDMSEVSSVKGDQERKKTQVPPQKKSGREREDTEDQATKPMKAATAVVRRIIQRITAKTVLALRDYSETGDPHYLLLVQRHLTTIKNENGDLPLHLAVINSQTTALQHLLVVMMSLPNARQIINTHNYIRQTALHLAAIMQQPLAIELLLHTGADPSLADRNGNTPAHLAVLNNSVEGLRSLVKYLRPGVTAANPFPELDYLNYDGYSPVHLAALQGNVDMLRLLVHGQADLDLGDGKSGRTALHHAVELDDLPVAGFLLMEANADVNARCYDGNTPLHVACCRGLIGMVALLMTAGALTDVENEEVPSEDCGEGGRQEAGESRHCRRGLQPRDYVVGKDRLQILRMLMGDTADEDDYQSFLDPDLREDPDLRNNLKLTADPDLQEGHDHMDDPDPTADLDHEEDCHCSVVNDLEQDMQDSETHKATHDSGVVDSLASQSASSFPVQDKLSQEGHEALSKLLDPECPGKDVLELAGRLGYDTLVPALEVMACSGSSPTLYLLDYNETYGTLSKLRECLQAMERDDALQILDTHM